jgi:predicted CoA-binding protein
MPPPLTSNSLGLYLIPTVIDEILASSRTVAVVGLSTDPAKASHRVAVYLQSAGYRIVPIHPSADELLGEKAYPSLTAVPHPIDLVDVFRPASEAVTYAEQAVAIRARAFWLQLGIVNLAAGELAARAGLAVVMDRCTLIEHQRCLRSGFTFPRAL